MKKNILWLTLMIVLIISCKAKSANSDNDDSIIDDLITQLDSLSLEDGQTLYLKQYKGLTSLLDYMDYITEIEPTTYTEDEEIENKADSIPTSVSPILFTKESLKKNIKANHRFVDPFEDRDYLSKPNLDSTDLLTSVLVIENSLEDLNRYLRYTYTLDSIYYKDGSSKKVNLDLEKYLTLENLKLIDKVSLTVDCPTDLATIVISDKQKTARFGDATITLESIDKNTAKYRIEGEGSNSYITSQAKTKSGYYVNSLVKNSSTMSKEEIKKFRSTTEKYLGAIAKKIEAGKYNSKEELISDLKENSKYVYIPNESKYRHLTISYKGNVDQLYLYFTKNKEKDKIRVTIPVKEELYKYNLRINNLEKGTNVIIDENNRIVARIPDEYRASQLNNYYYSLGHDNDEKWGLYRLDPEKGLTKVDDNYSSQYNIKRELSDDLLLISLPNDIYKNGALDRYGKVVIPIAYLGLKRAEKEDLIIASNGNPISDNSNYTLYDLSGKKIASGEGYISISGFEDGIASVKKDDKKGYIDNKGKLVIPFIYGTFSSDFENGTALVKNSEGLVGIINKKNEVILPFKKYNYISTSRNEQGRVYILGDKQYDSYGKLIK